MAEREKFYFDQIDSPIGKLTIVVDRKGAMRMLWFEGGEERLPEGRGKIASATVGWRTAFEHRFPGAEVTSQRDPSGHSSTLRAYFKGDMDALDRIPVVFDGTPFQNKVWKALRRIPIGTTTSYGALAKKIGEPKAVRAVGLANGSNPIGLVVPCHRVIGSDGSLTGYGGGLPRKKWLLEHEARYCGAGFRLEALA
ncbi:MAG: methylated-DNA--[protein]-cysteine S-methyltransferase [Rhizomicrobium sp.]